MLRVYRVQKAADERHRGNIVEGEQIDTTLPDYRELDDLVKPRAT